MVWEIESMDSGLKQRLIGAAVLISLAVLFLPAVLDGRKKQQFEANFIPPQPQNKKLRQLAKELQQNNITQTDNNKKVSHSSQSIKPSKEHRKDVTKSHIALKNAYIIQVASFSDPINTQKMVQRLKHQGYLAYVGREKVRRKGKTLTRVLVGPIINKKEAENVLDKINRQEKLKATLVVYDTSKH